MILVNITEQVLIIVIIVDMVVNSIARVMKGGMEDMTENKRLTFKEFKRNYERGKVVDGEQLFNLIYDLAEENEELKSENKELKQFKNKILKVIDEKIKEYSQLQKDCETGKGWGSADRFIDYQMALIALKERLKE